LTVFFSCLVYFFLIITVFIAWLNRISCILGIPASVIGVTLGAAATSVPGAWPTITIALVERERSSPFVRPRDDACE
jgi:Ca2+/Na+ antiporter